MLLILLQETVCKMERIRKLLGREEEKEEKTVEEAPADKAVEEPVHEEAAPPEVLEEPVSEEPELEPEPEPEPEPEAEPQPEVEAEPEPEVEPEEAEPEEAVPMDRAPLLPYHSEFTERIKYLFGDPTAAAGLEGPDEFALEFMAEGERFYVAKEANGEFKYGTGSAPDEDVYIRIANDTVAELLSAATFADFSRVYIRDYRKPDAGKFVKIELRKDITSMNRRGYARIPLLKLLIGQAR
ncbi:MAG: hypothetical protein JSW05_06290 [Candidatus Thorarchaeota archaeon]|nr:MAG: hypothetical protein JSW05_06290 [Candidatus Thorarchaeota archaeon]